MNVTSRTRGLDLLRTAARVARRLPERLLHPVRRWRARTALAGAPPPRSILVVCLGNICRSPFAQADLERRLGGAPVSVRSVGFIRPGRPPPAEALAVAAERGFDLSEHRSRILDGERSPVDLVVFMDPRHVPRAGAAGVQARRSICLGDLDPRPIATRAVADPFGAPLEQFRRSFDRIERCNAALVRLARLHEPPPS